MDRDFVLSVHNLAYLDALQEAYDRDPAAVDRPWLPYLDRRPRASESVAAEAVDRGPSRPDAAESILLQTRVDHLVEAYRLHGHLVADIDPLGRPRNTDAARFELASFGLDATHLDRLVHSAGLVAVEAPLHEVLRRLRSTYTSHVGVEYWHIDDAEQRAWLQERIESHENRVLPAPEQQIRLLGLLTQVDAVDSFLHAKFVGAKRFSISGAETVIPLLDGLVEGAGAAGIGEVIFGMAHRGRLNVLVNLLGKSPREVFSEFSNLDAESYLGAGDVKYHLGYFRHHTTSTGRQLYLALTFNPSHLEAITPVVQGRIRATQDAAARASSPRHLAGLGVTLHGDAAFPGQGVVAETLNLSGLAGYEVGGSIRVVINNQIGFTTEPHDSRSTTYCTDLAHGLGVPVFHVNGDDVEAVAHVAELALAWRQRFHRDVVIDLVCYRRFGHNEGDDPSYTQPQMYEIIREHPPVRTIYERQLIARGTLDEAACEALRREYLARLEADLDAASHAEPKAAHSPLHGVWEGYFGGREIDADAAETAVSPSILAELAPRILASPPGFRVHTKMQRLLEERALMWSGSTTWNWAAGELMAYATLLHEGISIRLSGQDVRRGTFSHRHATHVDAKTGEIHSPLQQLATAGASFEIHNSPLSEYSVLGFEFGYSLAAPGSLVIWEAQFGDFANCAQVIIDQFISSSEDKWNRLSGIVLMLPHGFEGQGPEHSSARLERFLQLCAEDNFQVCCPSTPAQLFHLLRRQVRRRWRKPLVLMTPKSLLRFRPAFSPLEDFTASGFQPVIPDPELGGAIVADEVRRLLLCTGKVYYDLAHERARLDRKDVAVVRLEQLHPFPVAELTAVLAAHGAATELLWVQEEPRNMGAWTFVRPRVAALTELSLGYVGRDESASPATGSPEAHALERKMILDESFSPIACVRTPW